MTRERRAFIRPQYPTRPSSLPVTHARAGGQCISTPLLNRAPRRALEIHRQRATLSGHPEPSHHSGRRASSAVVAAVAIACIIVTLLSSPEAGRLVPCNATVKSPTQ